MNSLKEVGAAIEKEKSLIHSSICPKKRRRQSDCHCPDSSRCTSNLPWSSFVAEALVLAWIFLKQWFPTLNIASAPCCIPTPLSLGQENDSSSIVVILGLWTCEILICFTQQARELVWQNTYSSELSSDCDGFHVNFIVAILYSSWMNRLIV